MSYLLALPAETRLLIYEYIFKNDPKLQPTPESIGSLSSDDAQRLKSTETLSIQKCRSIQQHDSIGSDQMELHTDWRPWKTRLALRNTCRLLRYEMENLHEKWFWRGFC